MKKRISILGALIVMLMCSCVKTDYTAKTIHPLIGVVKIVQDWSSVSDSLLPPHNTTGILGIRYAGAHVDGAYFFPFYPGNYRVFMYNICNTVDVVLVNQARGIGEEDAIASIKTVNDTCVLARCDRFFGGMVPLSIEADNDYEALLPMKQVSRDLIIEIRVTEGDPARISSIEAALSGVSGAWSLLQDRPYGPIVNINPVFERFGDRLVSKIRLLGVKGTVQQLKMTLHFSDGRTQNIQSDLSAQLSDFNQQKSLPMTLSGSVPTPIQSGMSATITNWTVETGSVTAN